MPNASAVAEPAAQLAHAAMSDVEINSAFEERFDELSGRIRLLARPFPDRDEAQAEMFAHAFANFRSVARRRGEFLPAGLMAFFAVRQVRAGRNLTSNCRHDVHSVEAHMLGRSKVIHLSQIGDSKKRLGLSDSTVRRITDALSSDLHEDPGERARVRLDWGAFSRSLPHRFRRIIKGLTVGAAKQEIAKKLGISNGRLSQLLDDLGGRASEFFGPEIRPSAR